MEFLRKKFHILYFLILQGKIAFKACLLKETSFAGKESSVILKEYKLFNNGRYPNFKPSNKISYYLTSVKIFEKQKINIQYTLIGRSKTLKTLCAKVKHDQHSNNSQPFVYLEKIFFSGN